MKRLRSNSEDSPYSGGLRHYHRSTPTQQVDSWDDWAFGKSRRSWRYVKWFKVLAIILAMAALGGISVGLFIVLR